MVKSILLLHIAHLTGRLLYVFFALWYLNRYLGVEAKGVWASLFSLFGILSVFANMGFEVWLSRAVAANRITRGHAVSFLFRAKTGPWLLCLLIGAGVVALSGYPWLASAAFGAALVFDGIALAEQAVFEGKSKTDQLALMSFFKVGGFALVAGLAALIVPDPDLNLFAWCFAGILALRLLYGWRAWKLIPESVADPDPSAWKSFLTMGAYTLVTVLYFRIDQVMLVPMAGERAAGDYANAYDLVEGTLFISGAVAAVLYPRLVKADPDTRARLFDMAFSLLVVIAACGVCGMWVFGEPVGTLLAGESFAGALPLLYILAAGLPFMFANGILSRWLFSQGRERFALWSGILAALINIVGNILLIPRHGAAGAAGMTLVTEAFIFFTWVCWGRRSPELVFKWCFLSLPLALVGILFFTFDNPWLAAGATILCYLPLLIKLTHTAAVATGAK
ncbi:Flippase [Sulfidibacter corallicola]|uniref:Flippase n=1 Tax=Sulfidibacter corallicola TaxID=2818388 RepID=A0A8A4TXX1_SULCO|nr:flippase [Sulfidibacter corallicola]QTD54333.1 flippase [Sulfidibacter corallicola]